jgi:hypothetical protein
VSKSKDMSEFVAENVRQVLNVYIQEGTGPDLDDAWVFTEEKCFGIVVAGELCVVFDYKGSLVACQCLLES